MHTIKLIIKKFNELQNDILGYERYKILNKKFDYWVECYTKSGLLIKTVLHRTGESAVIDWINECSSNLCEEGVNEMHSCGRTEML